MKFKFIIPLIFGAFFFGCDSSDQIENRSSQPLEKDSFLAPIQNPDEGNGKQSKPIYISTFEKAFLDFQLAVFNEDAQAVNAFIDPEKGVYIIENPGAMPKMTLVKDIWNFKRTFQDQSFFTIKERLQNCKLKDEPLPTFNCAGENPNNNAGYSKEGCFVADAAVFRKSEYHKYASLPQNEIENIEATLPLVQKTVLQTASSYKFHFGKINGKWRILFIDLMIPCSA